MAGINFKTLHLPGGANLGDLILKENGAGCSIENRTMKSVTQQGDAIKHYSR